MGVLCVHRCVVWLILINNRNLCCVLFFKCCIFSARLCVFVSSLPQYKIDGFVVFLNAHLNPIATFKVAHRVRALQFNGNFTVVGCYNSEIYTICQTTASKEPAEMEIVGPLVKVLLFCSFFLQWLLFVFWPGPSKVFCIKLSSVVRMRARFPEAYIFDPFFSTKNIRVITMASCGH